MFNNHQNLHEMTNECINTITQIIERHAPIKQASRNRMKQLLKPWIPKGLIKSITLLAVVSELRRNHCEQTNDRFM